MPLHETSSSDASLQDGWTPSGETWTYASATTFTVSNVDVTAKYSKGTRIKLTQTTAKYFVVVGSSFSTNTTVTVTGGTDYTLANAAITSPYFSYVANPQGYPHYFVWAPSYVTGFSANPSTPFIYFSVLGETCLLHYQANTDGTSNATTWEMNLPVAMEANVVARTPARVKNNSAVQTTFGFVEAYSSSCFLYINPGGGAWTASGTKNAWFDMVYQI